MSKRVILALLRVQSSLQWRRSALATNSASSAGVLWSGDSAWPGHGSVVGWGTAPARALSRAPSHVKVRVLVLPKTFLVLHVRVMLDVVYLKMRFVSLRSACLR